METESIITIIICTAIMGMAIWYYYKACQTYDKADMMRIEAEATEETAKEMQKFQQGMIAVSAPLCYYITKRENKCAVMAEYENLLDSKTTECVVKIFPYEDDPSYALREAEYLLSTLNEK